ncbi:toll/interleukin-1 receptor domain-containing protein [Ruminococcus albus]|nr:toll/interleukin-1 receptor domain-containing protein [Ruminococcus albus]MCC3351146.1 toll/interleukin-1 receptor domain-containing protein [Ruminococcus albus 8]
MILPLADRIYDLSVKAKMKRGRIMNINTLDNIEFEDHNCDIFISYKRDGGDDLSAFFAEELKNMGYRVFLDVKQLKDDASYVKRITEEIENCKDFIFVLSADCFKGVKDEVRIDEDTIENEDWLAKEIRLALKSGRHMIPLIKHNYSRPDDLPPELIRATEANGVTVPIGYFGEAFFRLVNVFLNSTKNYYAEMDSDTETKRRIQEGEVSAKNEFALKTEIGTFLINKDKAKALDIYLKAAEEGLPAAYYNIADILEKCADDVYLSYSSGYAADTKIKELPGIKNAHDYIDAAVYYYNKADALYREKKNIGYAPALYRLGVIKEKEEAYKDAFKSYSESAKQQYVPAVNAVAFYYATGKGEVVTKDVEKAKSLFESISDELPFAAYNYAKLMADEKKTADVSDLIKNYEKAYFSKEPVPQAAYELAKIYQKQNDIIKAKHFYYLALEGGYYPADKEIKKIEQEYLSSYFRDEKDDDTDE